MPTFKEITAADIKTSRSVINQLVDVVQSDISGSGTRRKYQVFVTGGIGPGVTSSLFQTIHDQDYTLQTANPVFDMTFGIYSGSATAVSCSTGVDSAGKVLFPSQSLMMREKIDIYRQHARVLLGDSDGQFSAPFSDPSTTDYIDEALFLNFRRLFARDKIKPQTYAMQFFTTAVLDKTSTGGTENENIRLASTSGSVVFTDAGQTTEFGFAGQIGNIVNSADNTVKVGVMFYDQGVAVLDVKKIVSGTQHMSGVIDAMSTDGITVLGAASGANNPLAKFIPDFVVSASIDDLVDHFASCRLGSSSNTAITFQNNTNVNSTLVFCRATADEFNYSSNPTFLDSDGNLVVISDTTTERTFSYITSVGLYDANDNLLAVAKLSRPIEKNDEKDLTIRMRLDF